MNIAMIDQFKVQEVHRDLKPLLQVLQADNLEVEVEEVAVLDQTQILNT